MVTKHIVYTGMGVATILVVLLVSVLLNSSEESKFSQTKIGNTNYCNADDDCAPVQCCHTTETINKMYKEECFEVVCTQECVPETTDCGQGEIKCINNECKVVLF